MIETVEEREIQKQKKNTTKTETPKNMVHHPLPSIILLLRQPFASRNTLASTTSLLSLALCLFITTTAANPATTASALNLSTITFEEGYTTLFSEFNIERSPDDKSFRLLLNRFSGHNPNRNATTPDQNTHQKERILSQMPDFSFHFGIF